MNLALVIFVALIAGIAAGGVLVAGLWLLLRFRHFDAATRHTLWFATLLAMAVLPVVGIGGSVARAVRHSAAAVTQTVSSSKSAPWSPSLANTPAHTTLVHPISTSGAPHFSITAALGTLSQATFMALDLALALGALAGIALLAFSVVRVRAVKRRSSPLDGSLADELPWLTDPSEGKRESYVRLSYEIEAPVAIGFRRPVILIPTDLATRDGLEAIEDLVVHEHAHISRYDDYTNLAQRAIERVYWFNPLVWMVGRQIALAREIAADDAVVARNSQVTRYAEALWRLAREMRMPAHTLIAPGALFTRKQISVRIEALLAPGRASLVHLGPVSAACALGLALVTGTLVAFAAPGLELPVPSTPPIPATPAIAARPAHPAPPAWSKHAVATVHAALNAAPGQPVAPKVPSPRLLASSAHVSAPAHLAPPQPAAVPAAPQHPVTHAIELQHSSTVLRDEANPLETQKVAELKTSAALAEPIAHAVGQALAATIGEKAARESEREIAANLGGVTVGKHETLAATSLTRELIARCTGCDLSRRDLRGMDLHGLTLTGFDLSGADLRNANLSNAHLTGTDLSHARLDGADLRGTDFTGADISGTSFRDARMDGTRFTGVSFRGADIDPTEMHAILKAGCSGCDFSHMNLHGADLHGIELNGADFSHSDLTGANLRGVRFNGVSLNGADLANADLRDAALTGCSLDHANLTGAHLEGISLTGTSLSFH